MPPPQRQRRPVSLADVRAALPDGGRLHGAAPDAAAAVVLSDVSHDSRDAGPGVLFAARPGTHADGHAFAPAAVSAGCPALLVERPLDLDVPQLVTRSVARGLGPAAAAVHGHPARDMLLLGVTGTSGKTTTTYLLDAILRAAAHVTGLIGTVQTRIGDEVVPGARTTPESTDLQRLLRRMVTSRVTAAAMEVSSHGLALGRVAGTRFRVAGFTNLSQDHLDFHADLDDYFAAKAALFTPAYAEVGVVVVDDAWGLRLAERSEIPVITVSAAGAAADVTARDIVSTPTGSSFVARLRGGDVTATTQLPGAFNVANTLLALAMADCAGVPADRATAGVAELAGVPGRMQRVEAGQPFTVLVDYAHKPDALAQVLTTARGLTARRVIVVVGCGGDRDTGKRALMGETAAGLADLAVLTSDNPRTEDPDAILAEVEAGARRAHRGAFQVEPDRRAAISAALRSAGPADVVVIAGKGHETYQELADRTVAFDDRAVARELLAHAERSGQTT
ncbi:UDP-N-acetylmuramoyl-L-alanyl-D-glutamate--2,6-diaminopimelate ligase [soil metagenome]